ncbi:uncharacterized protein LOC120014520 [Tripterygium wilfordii]|uniref:uncharacterized protein LOC120014520 n=1 Tax=Tripterygium wilfordii TaxID=458696 RepID=UPI0018F801BA|nr:uncharacterized protein LOC120014520 [Tripterygium wilfordii]
MFYSLCKTILHGRRTVTASPTHNLRFLRLISLKCVSSSADNHSFVVSYLVNSCGFSPETALNASKHVHFETPEKPDSVIAFLRNHGLTEPQIFTVINKLPCLLVCDAEKYLLPKLEYFYSKGMSSSELAKIMCYYPATFRRSLEKQLIPTFDFFTNVLKSEEKAVATFKRYAGILNLDLEKTPIASNINILRENGVPESKILTILRCQPRAFFIGSDRFRETVEEVKRMGFNPFMSKFVLAVFALRTMSKSLWQKKVDVYKKWGWSDEDVIVAFGRCPWCMTASVKKIMAVMDYFINVMELEPSIVCKYPVLVSLSLEKRIVPRGSVAQVLLLKGQIEERSLFALFSCREELFLEKFVKCYEDPTTAKEPSIMIHIFVVTSHDFVDFLALNVFRSAINPKQLLKLQHCDRQFNSPGLILAG